MTRTFPLVWVGILFVSIFAPACAPVSTPVPPIAVPPPPTASPAPTTPSPTSVPAAAFSFPKGAQWTYQGNVKWEVKGKVQQKNLTWKMQIADKIERADGVISYVMKGHPLDLAFYDEGKKPSDYLYIAKVNRVYQTTLISNDPIDRLRNQSDPLTDMLTEERLVLEFPLAPGKRFGPAQFVASADGMNAWTVAEGKATTLNGIKGITPVNATEYMLELKTNPDRQTVYFVPNIGITRLTYVHHGTIAEVDVKLVEYSTGG